MLRYDECRQIAIESLTCSEAEDLGRAAVPRFYPPGWAHVHDGVGGGLHSVSCKRWRHVARRTH